MTITQYLFQIKYWQSESAINKLIMVLTIQWLINLRHTDILIIRQIHNVINIYLFIYYIYTRAGIVQSVQRLATSWTVQGSNPGEGEIFRPVQTGHGDHPASYTMGTGSFLGVKRPRRDVDHPPPIYSQGQGKSIAITLLPIWVFVACSMVSLPLHLHNARSLTRMQESKLAELGSACCFHSFPASRWCGEVRY